MYLLRAYKARRSRAASGAKAHGCRYTCHQSCVEALQAPISSERFWPMRKMAVHPSRQPIMTEPSASYVANPVMCVIQVDTPARARHARCDMAIRD